MVVESKTVQDLVSRVSYILTNDPTPPATLQTEIQWALDWSMRDMALKGILSAFKTEAQLSLVAGTSDYTLPDDFYSLIEPSMYFNASPRWPLRFYTEQDRVEYGLTETLQTSARPYWWTILGRDLANSTGRHSVRFLPTPDTTYTINYTYIAVPESIVTKSLNEDIDVRFPRDKTQALIYGAATMFPAYLGADQQQYYQAKYLETLQDLRLSATPVIGNVTQNKRYRTSERYGTGYDDLSWPYSVSGVPHQ